MIPSLLSLQGFSLLVDLSQEESRRVKDPRGPCGRGSDEEETGVGSSRERVRVTVKWEVVSRRLDCSERSGDVNSVDSLDMCQYVGS